MTAVFMESGMTTDRRENDNGNFGVAKNGELHGFLQEAVLAFREGDGAVALFCNALDENLFAAHGGEKEGVKWG